MENSNYPQQTYPGFQSFPPPTAWTYPDYVSSDDCNTPAWVIVGVVVILVILCGALFYYIWRRANKIRETSTSATPPPAPTPKKDPTPSKDKTPDTQKDKSDDGPRDPTPPGEPKKDPTPSKDKTPDTPKKAPPPMGIPIPIPGYCPACGQRGGLYSFSYICPQCKYKLECNVSYPPKK